MEGAHALRPIGKPYDAVQLSTGADAMPRLNRNVFSGAFGDRRFGGVGIDTKALEQADLLLWFSEIHCLIHLVQLPEGNISSYADANILSGERRRYQSNKCKEREQA